MTDLTFDLLRWCSVQVREDAAPMVVVSMQYGGGHDGPWTFRDFKEMVAQAILTRDREIEQKARYAERMDALAEERLIESTRLKQGFQSLVALVDELDAQHA